MKPAIVFVDLLEDFFKDPPLSHARAEISRSANDLAAFARTQEWPVVWVRQEFEADLSDAFTSMRDRNIHITIKDTSGCQLISEIEKQADDLDVVKKRYSAFFGTQLNELLRQHQSSHVIIGGVNTHACVRASAIDAFQLDYRVILATDTIASYDSQYHADSLRYLTQSIGTAMSNDEIRAASRAS